MAIVKRDKLCFNCLDHYKVTQCIPKFKCKVGKHKYHTSLCTSHTSKKGNDKGTGQSRAITKLFRSTISFFNSPLCKAAFVYIVKTVIAKVSAAHQMSFLMKVPRGHSSPRRWPLKLNLNPCGKDNISLAFIGSNQPLMKLCTQMLLVYTHCRKRRFQSQA